MKIFTAVACSIAVVILLSSCAQIAEELPQNVAVQKSPAPVASPTPEPMRIPACESANPEAQKGWEEFADSWPQVRDYKPEAPDPSHYFERLAGPAAHSAKDAATERHVCSWLHYIHGNQVVQYTSRLPDKVRDDFLVSLRDSDFEESSLDGYSLFSHDVEDPESYRMTGPTHIVYLFVEDIWIAILETSHTDPMKSALAALLATNPDRTANRG